MSLGWSGADKSGECSSDVFVPSVAFVKTARQRKNTTKRVNYVQFTDEFGREQKQFFVIGYCPAHLDPKYVVEVISDYLDEFLTSDVEFSACRNNDGTIAVDQDENGYTYGDDVGLFFCGIDEAKKLMARMKKQMKKIKKKKKRKKR